MQQIITLNYPEFTDDPATWRNHARPVVDDKLVKELKSIARTPDGRPRFILVWGCDSYIEVPDEPEYDEHGKQTGVEKGGLYHENALSVYEKPIGFRYCIDLGKEEYIAADQQHLIPSGALITETVYETVSIGVPRFWIKEFIDRRVHPQFGDGDYQIIVTIDERKPVKIDEQEIVVESRYRPFERRDVETARNVYNLRQRLSEQQIKNALEDEKIVQKAERLAEHTGLTKKLQAIGEKFAVDREWKEKSEPVSIIVPQFRLEKIRKF